MFVLKNLLDSGPWSRHQSSSEVLNDVSHGKIQTLWQVPGHVLWTTNGNTCLKSLDITPVSKEQVTPKSVVILSETKSPISKLIFFKKSLLNLFVVFQNGNIDLWHFDNKSYEWLSRGCFYSYTSVTIATLDEGCHDNSDGTIRSAVFLDTDSTLYWCEQQPGMQTCCICSKPLPEKDIESSSDKQTLFMNAPSCELVPVDRGLVIWLREPCPAGVFVIWQPHKRLALVHVRGHGVIAQHPIYSKPLHFSNLMLQCATAWVKAEPISSWTVMTDYKNKCLLGITEKHELININSEGIQQTDGSSRVLDSIPIQGQEDVTAYHEVHGILILVSRQKLRVFEPSSGTLIQELDITSLGPLVTCWSSFVTIHSFGIVTEKGLWNIEPVDPRSAPSNLSSASLVALGNIHKSSHMTQLILEEGYKYYKDRHMKGLNILPEDLLVDQRFQSPALLLAILQQKKLDTGQLSHIEATAQTQILNKLNTESSFNTALENHVAPLLTDLKKLEQQRMTFLQGQGHLKVKSPSVREDLESILDVMSQTDWQIHRFQLDLIVEQHQSEAIDILFELLEVDSGTDACLHSSRWKVVLSAACPMFELMCRLIYKHSPNRLLQFVDTSCKVQESGSESVVFGSNAKQHKMYQKALDCLPVNSQDESSKKIAARALLLCRSHAKNCDVQALKLLTRHNLWEECLQVLDHCSDGTDQHLVTFHLLFQAMHKANVLVCYIEKLMNYLPEAVSGMELFDMLKMVAGDQSETPVFCEDDAGNQVKVGVVRPHILNKIV